MFLFFFCLVLFFLVFYLPPSSSEPKSVLGRTHRKQHLRHRLGARHKLSAEIDDFLTLCRWGGTKEGQVWMKIRG